MRLAIQQNRDVLALNHLIHENALILCASRQFALVGGKERMTLTPQVGIALYSSVRFLWFVKTLILPIIYCFSAFKSE